MAKIPAALAKKIANARASSGGNRLKDGLFKMVVTEVSFRPAGNGPNDAENDTLIFEMDVLTSESKPESFYKGDRAVWTKEEGVYVEANKPGSHIGVALVFSGEAKHKASLGNAKSICSALAGVSEDEADDLNEAIEYMTDDSQPMRGFHITADSFRKKIKNGTNAGNPCVTYDWSHVPQTPEEVASERARLDVCDKKADEEKTEK